MKTKAITLIVGVVVMFAAAISATAQATITSPVKILRTPHEGVLKLLFTRTTSDPVNITFSTRDGEVARDRVTGEFPKGFQKKYNVNRIADAPFWIRIESSEMSEIYKVKLSADRKYFTYHLERATYVHQAVAQR